MTNFLLYAAAVLIWGTTWFAIKLQLGVVPIEWSLVYRFFAASLILFVFAILTKRRLRYTLSDHKVFAGLGLLLFGVNYYLSYLGTAHLTSGLVAVVFSTVTLMNIINAALFLKRPLELSVVAASIIGLVGIGLIFWPEVHPGCDTIHDTGAPETGHSRECKTRRVFEQGCACPSNACFVPS